MTLTQKKSVGIIGAGAWGTALGFAMHRAGHAVRLWMRDGNAAYAMQNSRMNERYLPGYPLPDDMTVTAARQDLEQCDVILICTPAQHVATILPSFHFKTVVPLLICAKGIDIKTGHLLSQIVANICPQHPLGILTGPSFAQEVAEDLPTALTLAMDDSQTNLAYDLCQILSSPHVRIYASQDMIGAQIGGAVKNVIAIACGIASGKNLGDNAPRRTHYTGAG